MVYGYEEMELVEIFEESDRKRTRKVACSVCGKKVKREYLDEDGLCPRCQEEL